MKHNKVLVGSSKLVAVAEAVDLQENLIMKFLGTETYIKIDLDTRLEDAGITSGTCIEVELTQ